MMIMVIIVVWGLGPVGLGWVWVDEMDPRTTLITQTDTSLKVDICSTLSDHQQFKAIAYDVYG